ncbi:MAG: VIT1/CCC1 transporter family protein [Verrucomicrobia bacterium]|nr:VIT1/CCC1 transporter family protein [Verrucomicrobiota bacterium]
MSTEQKTNIKIETDSHFKGKSVFEHLRAARLKGLRASEEHHGLEPQGHLVGAADAAKETAVITLFIWTLATSLKLDFFQTATILGFVTFGLFIWKMGRLALVGWARLERVNRLIADEKHEIETNREEEKEELTEIYRAKGFNPPLLDKVIDILMADDNKLLGVMLEEELGVALEVCEHPLKQAFGAGVGVLLASCLMTIGLVLPYALSFPIISYFTVFIASYVIAKIEGIRPLPSLVWNLSLTFLATSAVYFLCHFFLTYNGYV